LFIILFAVIIFYFSSHCSEQLAAERREKEREEFQVRDKERQRLRAYIEGLLLEFYKDPPNAVCFLVFII
jgi:hypothetical protein